MPSSSRNVVLFPVNPGDWSPCVQSEAPRDYAGPRLIDTSLLPPRVGNALKSAAIYFLEDLATRSRRELLALRGIGKRGISDIDRFLAHSGKQPAEASGTGQLLQAGVTDGDRFSGHALAG